MTNIEKYNKVIKDDLKAKDEDLNDEVLVFNSFQGWNSVTHMEMVSDMEDKFGVMFSTLDITSFSNYGKGIEILKKLGVDMSK